MKTGRDYKFWFCTGSQDLYGDECLRKVAEHSKIIVEELNKSGVLPFEVVWKPTLITNELIRKTFNDANADENCAGVIAWMHTFSPAKSWILGLKEYRKPLCHLHTQFNVEIPYDTIDMDFMNENQSAHGGREFGHMVTRMGIERKVIAGHWADKKVQERLASWMRTAVGIMESSHIRVCRVADNMRNVAVTEGDKVEAQIKFGWEVDAYPVNEVVEAVNAVSQADIDTLVEEYYDKYDILLEGRDEKEFREHVAVQAGIELGFERFLDENNYQAVVTHFGDLGGLKQLPGLAMQRGLTYGSLTTIIIENMKLERDEKISAMKEKEMQKKEAELQKQVAVLEEERAALQEKIKSEEAKVKEHEEEMQNKIKEYEERDTKNILNLQQLAKQLAALQDRQNALGKTDNEAEEEVFRMKQKVQQLVGQKIALEKKLTEKIVTKESKIKELSDSIGKKDREIKKIESNIEDMVKSQVADEVKKVEERAESIQKQLDEIGHILTPEDLISYYEQYSDAEIKKFHAPNAEFVVYNDGALEVRIRIGETNYVEVSRSAALKDQILRKLNGICQRCCQNG